VKPAAGYLPLAYSSPEPVQTPGTVAQVARIDAAALGEHAFGSGGATLPCIEAPHSMASTELPVRL
jgi:hypothetical protein